MTYETVPLDGIVTTTIEGTLDLAASTEVLLAIAREASLAGRSLLVDLRDANAPGLTFADVYTLVCVLEAHQEAFSGRIALLDRFRESFEKAQFFEASSVHAGLAVHAFLDEDEAVAWLSAAPC